LRCAIPRFKDRLEADRHRPANALNSRFIICPNSPAVLKAACGCAQANGDFSSSPLAQQPTTSHLITANICPLIQTVYRGSPRPRGAQGCIKLGTRSGRAVLCARLVRVSPLLAPKRVVWKNAFRLVRDRGVQYLDTSLEPQLHKPNRVLEPGRVMGHTWEPHRG